MVDIAKLVYEQLKERPEFAWIGVLEAISEQLESELAIRDEFVTRQLDLTKQQLNDVQEQLTQVLELVTAAPTQAADFMADVKIRKGRKHGPPVITAPQPITGGYRTTLEHFIESGLSQVIVDMAETDRSARTIYNGLKSNIKPEEHIDVYTRQGHVFLQKAKPSPVAPTRKVVLDKTQLERLPEDKRAAVNGLICQMPGCGMPLFAHQSKYCSMKHVNEHRAYMRANGIDRQTVEPISSVPEDVGMRGVTVVCGEAVRASRKSDGGPGSDHAL